MSPSAVPPPARDPLGSAGLSLHETDAPGAASTARPGLCRFAILTTVAALLLIKLGAMVSSTGSGMAYLDWPLANGSLWPKEMYEWSPGLFEHGHRTLATLVGLLTLVLTIWTLRVDARPAVRRFAIGLLALVVAQGLLGGLTVLMGAKDGTRQPSPWISTAHGVVGQVFLCALTVFAFAVSRAFERRTPISADIAHTARRLTGLGLLAVFAQLGLGAIVRHLNITGVLWLHISMAIVVALLILVGALYCSTKLAAVAGFRSTSRVLLIALGVQLALGVATLVVRGGGKDTATVDQVGRALTVTGHVAVGAVMFLLATLLYARTRRNLVAA